MPEEIKKPLKAKIKKSKLDDVIGIVNIIADETRLYIDESGIRMRDVDPAHVGMVDVELNKDAFESFEGSEAILGLPIAKLSKATQLATSDDTIKLEHETEKDRLCVQFGHITQRIPLLNTEGMTDPNIPDLDLETEIVSVAEHIKTGIRATNNISDHVSITVSPQNFKVFAEEDEDSVDLTLGLAELEKLEANNKVKAMFALDYLSDMVKQIPKKKNINIFLGPDYPIKIEFEFAGGNGSARYLLAPRIEG